MAEIKNKVLNKRTSGTTFTNAMKTDAEYGELLVAYGANDPKLGIKNSNGTIVEFSSDDAISDAILNESAKKAAKEHAHGTITLSGDAEGSAKIGSGETAVNITVTVKDDSHSHNGSYYSKSEVDAKVKAVSDTMAERYGFSKVQVSGETGTTISADSVTDTLYLVEGEGIDVNLNANDDKITIALTDATIENINKGVTAHGWGNHSKAGYYKEKAATTAQTGTVQLNDTVTSTSTVQAATPNAVKIAYEKAVEAYNVATGKTSNVGTVTDVSWEGKNGLTGSGKISTSGTISISGVTSTTAATGVAKLVRNDLSGYTSTTANTDGLAAAAYHTHSQYADKSHSHGTVKLEGDVTGSASFTNNGVTITTVVGDNTHNHSITANAADDDVVILTSTGGTNGVSYTASHADKNETAFEGGTSTTSVSGYGAKATLKIPKIAVDKKGHVTATDETVTITMPSEQTIPTELKNPTSLTIQKNGSTVATYDGASATTANIVVPTKVSDLTDDTKVKNAVTADKLTNTTIGSATVPIYISSGTPTECSLGAAANKAVVDTVTSGGTSLPTSKAVYEFVKGQNYSTTVGTVTSVAVEGASGLTGKGTVTSSGTITIGHGAKPTSASSTTGVTTGNTFVKTVGIDAYGHVATVATGTPANTTYTFTNKDVALEWGKESTIATVGGTDITVTMPPNPNTDTATTESGHYDPSTVTATYSGSSTGSIAWGGKINIPSVSVDSNGHIVSGTTTSLTMPSNPNTNYTTHMYVGDSGTTNAHTASDNPYIKVLDNTTIRNKTQLVGGGATTVKSTTAGTINITSTDQSVTKADYHYSPSSSTTKTANTSGANSYVTGVTLSMDAKGHVTGVSVASSADDDTKYTFTNKDANLDWGTKSTIATVGGTDITVTMPSNPDTHYTTRIKAGASGATANAAADNPYITVTDNNTYRDQIRLVGSGRTTVKSDSAGTITITSTAPTKVSELTNDSNFITSAATVAAANKVNSAITLTYGSTAGKTGSTVYSGNSKPTVNIPTSTSHITNDSGYITSATTVAMANEAKKVTNPLKFGAKTYNGSSEQTITAEDLGLGQALKYCGVTTTALVDGSTATTVSIKVGTGTTAHTASAGCVVFYEDKEFVYNGSVWELIGAESTYKVVQAPVSDPSASSTSITFIDTISQDANGVIKPTKKTVRSATTAATGVVKLVTGDMNGKSHADGQAPSLNHTHSQYLTAETYKGTVTSVTVTGGTGLTGGGTVSSTGTITISHADTSSANSTSVSTTGAEAIKGINLDAFGHVTGITTGTTPDTKSFTITATATDDDVVILTGTNGTNKVTFDAKHATQGPNATGNTSTTDTTSQSPAHGGKATLNIPKFTVNKYGHVTSLSNQAVSITFPSDNNTHYTSKNVVGATSGATANSAATNGNVWLNHLEESTVKSSHKITGAGSVSVTADSAGTITITGTDTNTKVTNVDNHYIPSSSTTIGATSGNNYVRGLYVDKAGHVVSVATGTPQDASTNQSGHYTPSTSATSVSVGAQKPSHGGTFNVPTLAFDSKGHYVSSGTAAITLPAAPSNATTAATGVVKLVTGDMKNKSHADGQAPSLNHTHSQYQAAGSYLSGNTTYAASSTVGGDAKKAVQLTNTRAIWGQNFNGTANVSGNMTGVGSITMTGDIAGAQNISAAKKVNVGSSAIQYNATTGCMEIIC